MAPPGIGTPLGAWGVLTFLYSFRSDTYSEEMKDDTLCSGLDDAWTLVERRLAALPPPLNALGRHFLDSVSAGGNGYRTYFSGALASPIALLPLWLRERFLQESPHSAPSHEVTVRLAAAAMWGYFYIRIQDNALDDANSHRAHLLLGNVCGMEMVRLFGEAAGDSGLFHEQSAQAWLDFTRCTLAEHEQLLSDEPYTEELFLQHCDKVAFARVPALAMCLLAGRPELQGAVKELILQLGVAYGLVNDALGWPRDLENHHRTYLLARAGYLHTEPGEDTRERLRPHLYEGGLLVQTLEQAALWQRRAAETAATLGLSHFSAYTQERLALLEKLVSEVNLISLQRSLSRTAREQSA